jgi:hypothetical protein
MGCWQGEGVEGCESVAWQLSLLNLRLWNLWRPFKTFKPSSTDRKQQQFQILVNSIQPILGALCYCLIDLDNWAIILSSFPIISALICLVLVSVTLIALLQLSLIQSPCFHMVHKVSLGITMELDMSALYSLHSYLLITSNTLSRVTDIYCFVTPVAVLSQFPCLLMVIYYN